VRPPRRISRLTVIVGVASVLFLGGCGDSGVDPTPERKDGSSSGEFESDDIEKAEGASDALREYCSGAVSEAQEVGCLSHADESDIP